MFENTWNTFGSVGTTYIYDQPGYAIIVFNRVAFLSRVMLIDNENYSVIPRPNTSMTFNACYFAWNTNFICANRAESVISFQGCTFAGNIGWNASLFFSYQNGYVYFRYCYFNNSLVGTTLANWENRVTIKDKVSFHGCYFECDTDIVIYAIDTGNVHPIPDYCDTSCVFNHIPSNPVPAQISPPTTLNFTETDKDDYLYSKFDLPIINDPSVTNQWVTGDYNFGLFGNTRLTVGAFYSPPPPPSAPAITLCGHRYRRHAHTQQ